MTRKELVDNLLKVGQDDMEVEIYCFDLGDNIAVNKVELDKSGVILMYEEE